MAFQASTGQYGKKAPPFRLRRLGSLYRQREREALGCVVSMTLQSPVTRCVSSWVFLRARCPHECTKQTLAGLRPRGTGGPGRGYERCRVARPEHLNPWRARRTSRRSVDFERAGGRHAAHPKPDGIFGGKDRQQIPPSSCSPSRQLRTASRLRITSVPSRNGRGRRTEWRATTLSGRTIRAHPRTSFPP